VKEIRIKEVQSVDQESLRLGMLNECKETERVEGAAEQISHIEQLHPKVWSQLTETQREWSLRRVGEKLSQVYECPAPPFISGSYKEENGGITRGEHSNFDYITKLNREVIEMDDSGQALETYCHEFRHAYQHEMAGRYDSAYMHRQEFHLRSYQSEMEGRFNSPFRHLCHDETKAAQWAENLKPGNYVSFEEDPERYAAQPVEKDARDFGARVKEAVCRRRVVP